MHVKVIEMASKEIWLNKGIKYIGQHISNEI